MIISVLVENRSDDPNLGCQHGLSLYIETGRHKLLFDTGAGEMFAVNAEKMGTDLSKVDIAVISHGHSDHGGGLGKFIEVNGKAKIYVNRKAFMDHYADRPGGEVAYIGLDKELLSNDRFVFLDAAQSIGDGLWLFSDVEARRLNPSGNDSLLMKRGEEIVKDDFSHEQNLVIREGGKTVLLAGCAHKGIVNIMERYRKETGSFPDVVIGGFHLYNKSQDISESPAIVAEIAQNLLAMGSKYFTCHCTGDKAYKQLKDIMGDKMGYFSTGNSITI